MKSIDSLRSLEYRPFRRLFIGAIVSNIGTWMETVTIGIYMETVTRRAIYVAAALVAGYVPQALMGLFSGSIADRFSRKHVLLATNTLSAFIAGTLALSVAVGFAYPWFVITLLFCAGFLNSVSFPAWQAFLSDIVPEDKIAGALSLMFAQWNLGRVVGPSIAALLITGGHYAPALFINTVSFFVVIVMIILVHNEHYQPSHIDTKKESVEGSLTLGWKYIFSRDSGLRTPYMVYALTAFWASPFIALIPNVADEVFKYKDLGTSLFTTFQGIGAVIMSVALTTFHVKFSPTRSQQMFLVALPIVLIGFGLSPNLFVATPISLCFGITYLGTLTSITLAAQLTAPPYLKGRVSAAFMATLGFLFPLGSIAQSIFVELFGARKLFVSTGVLLGILIVAIGALKKSYHLPDPYGNQEEITEIPPEGAFQ